MRQLAWQWASRAMIGAVVALRLGAQSSRDSAGVLVVENARPAWTARERLSLAPTPQLAIGDTTNAPFRFRQIRGVFRLADGRIAVVDGGSFQLRLFASDGRFLAASAGRGDGPGQLADVRLVRRLRGDTIAISSGFATLSLYAPSGAFVRVVTAPGAPSDPPAARLQLLDVLADGRRLATPLPQSVPRARGSRWVDSLPVLLLATSGATDRTLGTLPYVEFEQGRPGPTPVWLSPIGVFAGAEDRFYAGFGDQYAIRVYGGDGALRSIIRRSWNPVPITPAEWEQWVVAWSTLWIKDQGAARDSAVDAVRRSPYAETLPAFSAFLVDRSDRLWVRAAHWQDAIAAGSLPDLPAVPSQWSVFDPRGRWLGDVEMPANFQPYDIGPDYVLGKARRDGVNQVVLYALRAGGR